MVLWLCIAGDVLVTGLAMVAAYFLRMESGLFDKWFYTESSLTWDSYLNHYFFGLLLYLALATRNGIYNRAQLLRLRRIPMRLLRLAFYWALIYLLISLVFRFQPSVSRIYVILAGAGIFISASAWRWVLHQVFRKFKWFHSMRETVLLVGWNAEAKGLLRAIKQDPHHPYDMIGVLCDQDFDREEDLERMGSERDIERLLDEKRPEIVLLTDIESGGDRIARMIEISGRYHAKLKIISSFFHLFTSGLKVQSMSGVPILGVEDLALETWYGRMVKRSMDVMGAVVGLTVSAPVLLFFMLRIRLESPGPVFYRQVRMGRQGKRFEILKLRSMHLDAEEEGVGWTSPGDTRLLRVGAFMRRWNIDEIPQFWNVLKGEMSLVGPRPERPELIEDFQNQIRFYNIRQNIKPGMTGWAQIHGWRGDTDLEERIRHDLFYMENWSVWLDCYIMIFTLFNYKNAV